VSAVPANFHLVDLYYSRCMYAVCLSECMNGGNGICTYARVDIESTGAPLCGSALIPTWQTLEVHSSRTAHCNENVSCQQGRSSNPSTGLIPAVRLPAQIQVQSAGGLCAPSACSRRLLLQHKAF